MPQGSQAEEPSALENLPSAHFSHCSCPEARCAFPGSHSLHIMEPDAGATLPTLQVSQLPLPDRAWKRPASQLSHSGWPLVLDRPSAHGRHCHAVALVENFPASHAVHDVAPVRLSVSKPGLHSKHPPSNGTGAYRPISQSTPGIVFKKGKLRVDVIDTRATNA